MDDDWGLDAIVRSCNKISTALKHTAVADNPSSSSTSTFQNQFHHQNENSLLIFPPDPLPESRNLGNVEYLQDLLLFKPIFPKFQNLPISPLSVIGGLQDPPQQQHQKQQQQQRHEIHPSPKSKRRKHQQKKKVCHVPAEGLSSDMWSWRKYGQKPIKGSPYPRGYYRCSTSKSCLARKQVERNRSDPSMFILTYTGEHSHPIPTHRNSLAGSTRQKPASTTDTDSPISSPAETVTDQKLDEEDEFGFDGNTMISDDFFEGLEDITGVMTWPTNSVTNSAAGR